MSKKSSFIESKANLVGYTVAWFLCLLAFMGIVQALLPKGRWHLLVSAAAIAIAVTLDKYYRPDLGEK
jgi:hypothetical protein